MLDQERNKIIAEYLFAQVIDKLDVMQMGQEEYALNIDRPKMDGQWSNLRCIQENANEIRQVMDMVYEIRKLIHEDSKEEIRDGET